MANDSNFDRNPLKGCNYGLEGGAVLNLGGCIYRDGARNPPLLFTLLL